LWKKKNDIFVSLWHFHVTFPLRALIHFELILVQGDRYGSTSSFLQVNIQFFQQHLLKGLSFLYRMILMSLLKIRWA
jgi:hypothetical protein